MSPTPSKSSEEALRALPHPATSTAPTEEAQELTACQAARYHLIILEGTRDTLPPAVILEICYGLSSSLPAQGASSWGPHLTF